MKTTIDKAGRVIIPAAIRERSGLKPGTELEVFADDLAIHLVPSAPEPRIERRGRRIVVKPSASPDDLPRLDVAAIIEEERNRWPW